jgi:hypothetical protein
MRQGELHHHARQRPIGGDRLRLTGIGKCKPLPQPSHSATLPVYIDGIVGKAAKCIQR